MKYNLNKIISEVLQEYSSDQRLPFDDDQFKNKNYLEQYADWLEDFGKYGELPPSKLDFWTEIEKAIKYIIDNNLHGRYDLGLEDKNELEIYNELCIIIGNYLIITDDNKIYVERQVTIGGTSSDYDSSDKNGKDPKTLYNTLVKNYNNNVGGCWSYKINGADAYCTEHNGDIITLKGYIRTDDIDFVKTVLLNFHYDNEHEIRVKPNSKVELFEVEFNSRYKIPLKGRLIVNSTYFGNNGKYKGDYATVDDGFGKFSLMDRNGKIHNVLDLVKNKIINNVPIDEIFHQIKQINEVFRCGIFLNYMYLIDWHDNVIGSGSIYFDYVANFVDNYVVVELNDKFTIIKPNGEYIYNGKLWFDFITNLKDGYSKVSLNNKHSFINRRGKLIGDGNLWFDSVTDFENGLAKVQLNNKFSLLNKKGELINNGNIWFDKINKFINGFAIVMLNNKFNFIDSDSYLLWDGKVWLDMALNFDNNGFAMVMYDNKCYYVDTDGNFYDYITKQPIPSPISIANESKKNIKNIIKEIINKYLYNNIISNNEIYGKTNN